MKAPDFLGKKILVITAHPDDESFCCAGTIYKNYQQGGSTALVCATLGGRGRAHLPKDAADEEVRRIRKNELEKAAEFLYLEKLRVLNMPDCEVADHKDELIKECESFLEIFRPDLIFGFGEDGLTGHFDHVAAGEAARQIAEEHQIPFYAFCLPPEIPEEYLKSRRVHGRYRDDFVRAEPDIRADIDRNVKLAVIKIHRSQFGDEPKIPEEIFDAEYFRVI